jgi:hypothetical protein
MVINDNLFQQSVSCPLKLYHYAGQQHQRYDKLPFRHRNKLHLRDAVSLRYANRRFTSDDTETAIKETENWLKEESVAVCGAVLKSGSLITRIPILVKEGSRFTVVQIHGKLRKRSQPKEISAVPDSRSATIYLLKAAYRCEVVNRLFPETDIEVQFFFPDRTYRCGTDNLYTLMKGVRDNAPEETLVEECNRLFTEVDATGGASQVRRRMPENVSHRSFQGWPIAKICDTLTETDWREGNIFDVRINRECKYCDFRKSSDNKSDGCWNQFFFDEELAHPDRHVFELIGHGNDEDAEKGFHFQEQVPFIDQFNSFELLQKSGLNTIPIYQRRLLQMLGSRDDLLPRLWLKSEIQRIKELKYPLHFLDFEAATAALPTDRGFGPYHPVVFQFSCHTLKKDGSVSHTGWLDDSGSDGNPHVQFVRQLAEVDRIFEGTLVQYSQFEYRALRGLLSEFQRNSMLYEGEIDIVKGLLQGESAGDTDRFTDLSKLIADYYYNHRLAGGLGLKQVLKSVLAFMSRDEGKREFRMGLHDLNINLLEPPPGKSKPDPYSIIGDEKLNIDEGSVAMNAWISMKSGLLREGEEHAVPLLLKRYCALDSCALLIIFRHLMEYADEMNGKDLVIFKE